jgi:hypothetical protein
MRTQMQAGTSQSEPSGDNLGAWALSWLMGGRNKGAVGATSDPATAHGTSNATAAIAAPLTSSQRALLAGLVAGRLQHALLLPGNLVPVPLLGHTLLFEVVALQDATGQPIQAGLVVGCDRPGSHRGGTTAHLLLPGAHCTTDSKETQSTAWLESCRLHIHPQPFSQSALTRRLVASL